MAATTRDNAQVVIEGGGVELRGQEIGGDLTVGFVRLPAGFDFGPALEGLPGDLCPCPHWGYLLRGKLEVRTKDGVELYEAGQAFYWPPGHSPVALEETEYVDFSPTRELEPVLRHVLQG